VRGEIRRLVAGVPRSLLRDELAERIDLRRDCTLAATEREPREDDAARAGAATSMMVTMGACAPPVVLLICSRFLTLPCSIPRPLVETLRLRAANCRTLSCIVMNKKIKKNERESINVAYLSLFHHTNQTC